MSKIGVNIDVRVWGTLEKVHHIDMNRFRWNFESGRLWSDSPITLDVFKSKLSDVIDSINNYFWNYADMYRQTNKDELIAKKWITKSTLSKAKKIVGILKANNELEKVLD